MKKGIKLSFNIKKALKTAILTLFLGLFLFDVAFADVLGIVIDGFENYAVGSYLPGQGGWTGTSGSWQVVNSGCYLGQCIKFINLTNYGYINMDHSGQISITDEGKQDLYIKALVYGTWNELHFLFKSSDGTTRFGARIYINSYSQLKLDWMGYDEATIRTDSISANTWYKISFEWSKTGNYVKYYLNDNLITTYTGLSAGIQYLRLRNINNSSNPPSQPWVYLDEFSGPLLTITGIGGLPDVFPTNPPDQAETIVNWASTTFSGQVKIPNEYEGTCYQMDIKLMAWAECLVSGTSTQIISFNLGNLKKNQTFDYSTTTAIQIASSSCPYLSVSYIISCVRNNELEQFYHWKNAYIKYSSAIPSPTLAPYITELPTPTEEVSCDNYSGIDKFICEIRNFFAGLFTPSPEKILNLKQKIETLKTQFPINYISKTKDFFDDLNNQLNEDIPVLAFTIPFSTSTQDVDFQFWQGSISFAGISQTILAIFKTFFTGLFILIFVTWAINFIKRIL